MTKMFPNESPIAVPGVKVTIPYLPCESEVIDETRTEPEKIRYTFTADKTFVEGRTYYTLAEGTVDTYQEASVTPGEPVEPKKYYEKIVEPAYTVETKTVYDRYTEGFWVDANPETGLMENREHAVEINRTVTMIQGNRQRILREHALGLWSNRHSLRYVPICSRLESNALGESARIFR